MRHGRPNTTALSRSPHPRNDRLPRQGSFPLAATNNVPARPLGGHRRRSGSPCFRPKIYIRKHCRRPLVMAVVALSGPQKSLHRLCCCDRSNRPLCGEGLKLVGISGIGCHPNRTAVSRTPAFASPQKPVFRKVANTHSARENYNVEEFSREAVWRGGVAFLAPRPTFSHARSTAEGAWRHSRFKALPRFGTVKRQPWL